MSATIFTVNWFPEKERTLATGLITTSQAIGVGAAFAINKYYLSFGLEVQEVLWKVMLFQNIMYGVVFVGFFILFREKP